MQTKLTLRLDERLIEQAKRYGKRQGKSVSQLVADYFALLEQSPYRTEDKPLPPLTRGLRGIAKAHDLSEADYREHLAGKHLDD